MKNIQNTTEDGWDCDPVCKPKYQYLIHMK